jgi:hypothetical protein
MLSEAYEAGIVAALEKLGVAIPSAADTAGNMVNKAVAPPEFTRSLDNFGGLSTKNRNVNLSAKRSMPKSMVNAAMGVVK